MSKCRKWKTPKLRGPKQIPPNNELAIAEPDWKSECMVCGASPIVPETGMCGPCTFGEAETARGNW